MGGRARTEFTENLEAVARGVRRLEEIRDPILREAVSAALRLRDRQARLDPASRARMRNTVLAALVPARPTLADRIYGIFSVLARPAPLLVRGLAIVVLIGGLLASATVASADSLPDDAFYAFKLAGEQLRLAVAVSPEDRAAVQLSIAEHRLDEAERLASAGREDDAIIATANYGESLANAAAELASLDTADPRTIALVDQLQTALDAQQRRVAVTAERLANDPRTAPTAAVLATVSATAAPGRTSAAARIADQAAAVTSRLSAVADDHARQADQNGQGDQRGQGGPSDPRATDHRTADPRTADPRTSEPRSVATRGPETPDATHAAAPTRPPEPTRAAPAGTDTPQAAAPPPDPNAARQAAERARHAAEEAKRAADKAKEAANRTPAPKPSPTRR